MTIPFFNPHFKIIRNRNLTRRKETIAPPEQNERPILNRGTPCKSSAVRSAMQIKAEHQKSQEKQYLIYKSIDPDWQAPVLNFSRPCSPQSGIIRYFWQRTSMTPPENAINMPGTNRSSGTLPKRAKTPQHIATINGSHISKNFLIASLRIQPPEKENKGFY